MAKKLKNITNQDGRDAGRIFFCPGCKCGHVVITHKDQYGPHVNYVNNPVWTWNGSYDNPTFAPSILLFHPLPNGGRETQCHSFVENGKIRFLSDCKHKLAGHIVDLPEMDFDKEFEEDENVGP